MNGMSISETYESRFTGQLSAYTARVEACLDQALPPASQAPERLHTAMRYAALNGGKRLRPLLVYAAGECLGVDTGKLARPPSL